MAYLLSKVLPLLVLPLGAALGVLACAVVLRRRWLAAAAMALLWIFSTGVVSQLLWRWVEHPWQRRSVESAPQADAIVVLSGGRHPAPGPDRISEWHDPIVSWLALLCIRQGAPHVCSSPVGRTHFIQVSRRKVSSIGPKLLTWVFR